MSIPRRPWLTAAAATALSALPILAQTTPIAAPAAVPTAAVAPAAAPPVAPAPAPAAPAGVAALVNGQPINEATVRQWLERVPREQQAAARGEAIDDLIEATLLDQYLLQMNVAVEKKDVDAKVAEITADLAKNRQTLPGKLAEIKMSEADFRSMLTMQLRWDRYAVSQATDKALHELFDTNKEMFDGTTVHARHILLTPANNEEKTVAATIAALQAVKKDIEAKVAAGLAKLPPNADNLTREKERMRLLDEEFASVARARSDCPSKVQGGDLPPFQRVGRMVEPFSRAAFAVKPYQMTDVVATQFGYHLILPLEHKPGVEVKFDDIKEAVKEVYCDRLREAIVAQVKAKSKIVVYPAPTTLPSPTPLPMPQ